MLAGDLTALPASDLMAQLRRASAGASPVTHQRNVVAAGRRPHGRFDGDAQGRLAGRMVLGDAMSE